MSFCPKCGKEWADGVNFCPSCGTPMTSESENTQNNAQNISDKQTDAEASTKQTNQQRSQQSENAQTQNAQQNANNDYSTNQQWNTNPYSASSAQKDPEYKPQHPNDKMYGILSYLTIIGWLVTMIIASSNDSEPKSDYVKFHLNQGLLFFLFGLLGWIPILGWIWSVVLFVFWIICFVNACQGRTHRAPLFGGIDIIK